MIEVRANLSFDQFRQGRRYQVDREDQRIQAQITGGYFTITEVPGADDEADTLDSAGFSILPVPGVAAGVERPKRKKKTVTDEDSDFRRESDSVHAESHAAFGSQDS